MSDNKNELSINVKNTTGPVNIENISQVLNSTEKAMLKKEVEDILRFLDIPVEAKENLKIKLVEAKKAIEENKPKSELSKIFSEAGNFLKDIAKEAGKTAISALIKSHM